MSIITGGFGRGSAPVTQGYGKTLFVVVGGTGVNFYGLGSGTAPGKKRKKRQDLELKDLIETATIRVTPLSYPIRASVILVDERDVQRVLVEAKLLGFTDIRVVHRNEVEIS